MSDLTAESRTQQLDRALTDLLAQTPEIEAAAVVSFDGLPMASALPGTMDEDRVAAMSAALLSLGERAAQGLGRGELSQVYIEGDTGTVFLVSCEDEAVLVAVAAQGAKVGMMLYEVRRAAKVIGTALSEEELEQSFETPAPVQEPPAVPAQAYAEPTPLEPTPLQQTPIPQPEPAADEEPMLSVVSAVSEVPPAPPAPEYELPDYRSTSSDYSGGWAPQGTPQPAEDKSWS